MTDNSENKNPKNDEIDLLDLFRRMGRGISNMFNWIGKAMLISIVFMLKRWVYLTISVLFAVGLSYLLKYTAQSFYSSEMVISSNAVSPGDVINYVNKLHTFSREKNMPAIAEALGLDENKINMVKDIEAFWVIDKGRDGVPDYIDYSNNHNVYDTVNVRMTDRLAIRVLTTSPQELSGIREGIFSYIDKNLLFEEQNRVRLSQIDEMLTRLNYDIDQLDSLQKVKYFEETRNRVPEKGGQMIFLQEQSTQLIYDDIYSLYSRKQTLDRQKEIYSGIVTLLSDFTVPLKPENTGSYYGKVLIPLFFGLCLLVLILIKNRSKLLSVYSKY